jgi:hypothetical protein
MRLLTVPDITTYRYSGAIELGEHRVARSMTRAIEQDLACIRRGEKGVQDPAEPARTGRSRRDFAVLTMKAARPSFRKASSFLHMDITVSVTEDAPKSARVLQPMGKGVSDATNL